MKHFGKRLGNRLLKLTLLLPALLSIHVDAYSTAPFRDLSVSGKLTDLTVNALYKDSTGYIWIGTASSLERFDGIRLKPYLIPGGNEKVKWVNAIAETAGNRLWIGNGMGLWRIDVERDVLVPVLPETLKYPVYALLPDGKGGLYVGTGAGLFFYRNDKAELLRLESDIFSPRNTITAMNIQGDSLLWMSTSDGLYSLRTADRHLTYYAPSSNSTYALSSSSTDVPSSHSTEQISTAFTRLTRIGHTLYLGTTTQGIICFDGVSKEFSRYIDVGCNIISSLSTDGKDLLYVGTDGNGVHFVSTSQNKIVRSFRHEVGSGNTIRSNSVYSLLVDRDSLIWIGFYQLGIDYSLYQNGLFQTYSYPPYVDTRDMPVRSIAITESERLIGSRDGLHYINEATNTYRTFKSPQLRSSMIFCIYPVDDKYYIGTYGGGMYIFDPRTLSMSDFDVSTPQPFLHGQIFCIRADSRGDIWIGTDRGLFCYREGKKLRHYTSKNSKLPEGNVYEVYFDSTRKGWICTDNGMCLWDSNAETLRTDVFPAGFFNHEKMGVVFESSDHQLYFLPDKGNLCISDLTMTRFSRLPQGTLLDNKYSMFVLEDAEHRLWIGTGNWLYRYDRRQTIIPYGYIDGIPSPVFTLCPPVIDGNGCLWMGNSKGLIYADFERLHTGKQYHYPPTITEQRVVGRNNVTFRFSDFTYSDPSYTAYEYRLEGYDHTWHTTTSMSEATYYNLPPGKYTFHLRHIGEPAGETRQALYIAYPDMLFTLLTVAALLLLSSFLLYLFMHRRRQAVASKAELTAAPKVEQQEKDPAKKYQTYHISAEECERLLTTLDEVMRRNKSYTNPNLKITDLAALAGSSPPILSYLFNQYLQRNYYDYINDYRIEEFKRLVAGKDAERYTLAALAEQCGFSSRTSFFRSFKKATGITPNEYMTKITRPNTNAS